MIPIRDTIRFETYPIVNNVIIGVNVPVFLAELAQGPNFDAFIKTYVLVPARYSIPRIAAYFTPAQQALAFLSFMFLHGGFLHLLGKHVVSLYFWRQCGRPAGPPSLYGLLSAVRPGLRPLKNCRYQKEII